MSFDFSLRYKFENDLFYVGNHLKPGSCPLGCLEKARPFRVQCCGTFWNTLESEGAIGICHGVTRILRVEFYQGTSDRCSCHRINNCTGNRVPARLSSRRVPLSFSNPGGNQRKEG